MKRFALLFLSVFALLAQACGAKKPADAPASAASSAPRATTPPAPAPPPPPPEPTASADAGAPPPAIVTTNVTTVSNEVTTPKVTSPDQVISGLRPKFNECLQAGLKKDPKTASGSVTLSAKIDKDGKVSAVNPKMLTGFNPGIVKCLTDKVKAAAFAPAGGMSYTTSLDIPVGFTTDP